jgi:hypothetical protein
MALEMSKDLYGFASGHSEEVHSSGDSKSVNCGSPSVIAFLLHDVDVGSLFKFIN